MHHYSRSITHAAIARPSPIFLTIVCTVLTMYVLVLYSLCMLLALTYLLDHSMYCTHYVCTGTVLTMYATSPHLSS
jgi:hypothetical protein